MSIVVKRLHPTFFGEVEGVDLARPVTPDLFAEIEAAFNEHAILLFRGQTITDAEQVGFSANFGPVFTATKYHWQNENRRLRGEMADISNIDHDGALLAPDDARRLHNRANQLWHTDNTFKHVPARCSLLSARAIPAEGGDTEFADMRAAWDMLDPGTQAQIKDLVTEHSRIFSKGALGIRFTEKELRDFAPVRQPLVRTHPRTARHSLFLSSHAGRIVGWPLPEALMLLRELTEHATQREFVYRHKWRVGDLVMWDNRVTMHRGRPYEDMKYPRDLRRTTLTCGAPAMGYSQALQ